MQLVFDLVDSIGGGNVKQTLERADGLISAGLSPDGLIAALSDHLRNLLIALTCGKESGLVDMPGLAEAELFAQAAKFDARTLAQDIAILEELRRNMRQNQTGLAMLDATLVRLTLAEQFAPIGPLLAQGGTAVAVEQKKKPEPVRTAEPPRSVEPVEIPQSAFAGDSTDLWSGLLAKLQSQASFSSVLGMAKFRGIENDLAIIRLPRSAETFVKQWNANGKKDQIARAVTELRGHPTGVRFEIDDEQPEVAAARPLDADAGPIVEFVLKEFGGTLMGVE